MKWCPGCQQQKQEIAFARNRTRRDGLQTYCRVCKKATDSRWYQRNQRLHCVKVKQSRDTLADQAVENLIAYFRIHPCVDCGESDPVVLEFDHVRGEKSFTIAVAITHGYSWTTLLKEIEKCEVRCANCHRRKTAQQFGYRRALAMSLAAEATDGEEAP